MEVEPGGAGYFDAIAGDTALDASAASAQLAGAKRLLAEALSPERRQGAVDRTCSGIFVDADLRCEEPTDVVHIGCVAGGGYDGSSDAQIRTR